MWAWAWYMEMGKEGKRVRDGCPLGGLVVQRKQMAENCLSCYINISFLNKMMRPPQPSISCSMSWLQQNTMLNQASDSPWVSAHVHSSAPFNLLLLESILLYTTLYSENHPAMLFESRQATLGSHIFLQLAVHWTTRFKLVFPAHTWTPGRNPGSATN